MQHAFINDILQPPQSLSRNSEKLFSISDLERFSRIKAHTIRIWEHRYAILSPLRSEGNVRMYTIGQVRRLLSIALLQNNGKRISNLSELTDEELEQKAQGLTTVESKQQNAINHLVFYMYTDIEKFEDVLDGCVHCWGIDEAIEHIIIPFLGRVELVCYKDKSLETHFVVTAIRKKMMVAIERHQVLVSNPPLALLFLPEKEHYDLVLLYMTYLLKRKGVRVLYLGTDISIDNIHSILQGKKPDFLYTYITAHRKTKVYEVAVWLHQHSDLVLHAVTHEEIDEGSKLNNVRLIHYQSFSKFINTVGASNADEFSV